MKKREALPVVGGSSLLVIFAVLCLTIFSLLALSAVQAEQRLANASLEAVTNYYQADTCAEQILAELRQGKQPEGVIKNGDVYSYQCEVSDVQTLSVQVRIRNSQYEILCWKLVSTTEWEEDDALSLWNGVHGITEE